MGLDILNEIAAAFSSLMPGLDSVARVLAWIGVALLLVVAGVYLIEGISRLVRAIASMKVKQFMLFMLGLAGALLAIAVAIP